MFDVDDAVAELNDVIEEAQNRVKQDPSLQGDEVEKELAKRAVELCKKLITASNCPLIEEYPDTETIWH